ncbi:MAG TPA: hypothetical protein QGH10_03520 [Armatimonadota bacterium]|nr:hypothetical protein [Armatimonadota bacterium]
MHRPAAPLLLVVLALISFAPAPSAQGTHALDEYGDVSTVDGAEEALRIAVGELIDEGGGVVVIPEGVPESASIENLRQDARSTTNEGPVVTIIDQRRGFLVYQVAPIGKHQAGTWAGLRVERMLNLGDQSLPHCGWHAAQAIDNFIVSGSSSYMATLTEVAEAGSDARLYVDLIRGIWVGAYLNVTSSVMGYAEPYDRITVKSIGWDDGKKRNYFTADLEHDHPVGALVYNKHVVNGLSVNGYSNADNQTPGEISATRHNYGVGDSFVLSGMFKYMGDVFSGFGDEGGIVLNAETVGEIESFHSKVEAVDWSRDEVTYEAGQVHAHTLSNSRPLINLNESKWITAGEVRIVAPGTPYKGQTYPGVIGGPQNVFNYQGGLIEGSADCPWDDNIIGRFFAVTDPSEVITPDDTSTVGGYASNPSRPIRRWYRIMEFEANDDGTKVLRILRVRWSAVAAGAPKLFDDDNYTTDDRDRPLSYAIAPGAWVYDISQGFAKTHSTGGHLDASHPRKIKVVAHADRGTSFDFESGDEIEQAVGADPWQPRPLRIRQFDQIPTTMDNATIEVQQLGRVQVPTCIGISGIIRSRDQLESRKDKKAPFATVMRVNSLADVGIDFQTEVLDAAIVFRQPNGHPQPIRWSSDDGSSSLIVDPSTGDFIFAGGALNLSGESLVNASGVSATGTPAMNLRGIDVAVPEGATELAIAFPRAEVDAAYAVSVTPSWMTALCAPTKSAEGFTVQFANAAPAGATIQWIMVR